MSKQITVNALPEDNDLSIRFWLDENLNIMCAVTIKNDLPGIGNQETSIFPLSDVGGALTLNQKKLFLKACRDHALTQLGY